MRIWTFVYMALVLHVAGVADTIHVPAEQPTIQAGIDAAVSGDTVLVAPGTYVENINLLGKMITVRSEEGPEQTTIDGGNPVDPDFGSVVTFINNEGPLTVLRGFTLTNGTGRLFSTDKYFGGGVYCESASPRLIDNIIRNNRIVRPAKWAYGGGLSCSGSIKLTNCSFKENLCNGLYTGNGGAIYFASGQRNLKNCTFVGNVSNDRGGAIYQHGGSLELNDCGFMDNRSGGPGGGISSWLARLTMNDSLFHVNRSEFRGGGVFIFGEKTIANHCIFSANSTHRDGGAITSRMGPLIMTNCVIEQNKVDANWGGGISHEMGDMYLTNCTIISNSAFGKGGGVYLRNERYPTYENKIANSIIWSNRAQEGSGIWVGADINSSCILKINHTNLSDGQGGIFIGPNSALQWGNGMIDSNPLFVDAEAGDYHLTHPSPCRNAGTNSAAYISQFDFEGDPRITDGLADIGADEFHNHLYCTGDFTPNGSIEGKFVGSPGAWPVGLFVGSGIMDPPLPHKWGDFYLESPWLSVLLAPIPADGVLSIPQLLPNLPVAPYDIPMQALIGWELSNLFVMELK